MTTASPTKKAEGVKRLAERLSQLPQVARYSEGAHDEAWTLAHAFEDLNEILHTLLSEKFPRLEDSEMSDEELYSLLLEIGEEFRHLQYHLHDPKFFRYLSEEHNP